AVHVRRTAFNHLQCKYVTIDPIGGQDLFMTRKATRLFSGPVGVRSATFFIGSILFLSTWAFADVVIPLDDVTTGVAVRKSASSQSAQVGTLHPNEQAELLGSVPNWHRIQLANGTPGFASKRWTRVVT